MVFHHYLLTDVELLHSPDHVHQTGCAVSLHSRVPQLRQLLVVGSRVVPQADRQTDRQLEEWHLDPLHLRVAVEQLETLGGHETVAEGGLVRLEYQYQRAAGLIRRDWRD